MSSSRTTTRNRRCGSTGRRAAKNSGMFPIGSITKKSRIAADVSVMGPIVPDAAGRHAPALPKEPGNTAWKAPLVRVAIRIEAKHHRLGTMSDPLGPLR